MRHDADEFAAGVRLVYLAEDRRAIHYHSGVSVAANELDIEPAVRTAALIRSTRDIHHLPVEHAVEVRDAGRAEDDLVIIVDGVGEMVLTRTSPARLPELA